MRIELFGDEIETLRRFDPATQRTVRPGWRSLLVTPAREFIPRPRRAPHRQARRRDLREFHIPLLHPSPASLLDYLPKSSLVLLDDQQVLDDTANGNRRAGRAHAQGLDGRGHPARDFPIPYLTWAEIADSLRTPARSLELGRLG